VGRAEVGLKQGRTSRKHPGRPRTIDADLALFVGFAHGRGVPLEDIAAIVGVSMATLRRSLNAGLLNDQRGQRLATLVSEIEWERDNYHVSVEP
jgi:hypothetical protein